ncbi:MAG: potassium channel family protein [Hyphomonadaceae bacterium]
MLAQNLAISAGMIVLCVLCHSAGIWGLTHLHGSERAQPLREGQAHERTFTVVLMVFGLLALHAVEILAYSLLYSGLGQFPGDFETALYFSASTFTTLGYGDVIPAPNHRLLAGVEGVMGLILIGWSTAILVSITNSMDEVELKRPGKRKVEAPQGRNSP